MQNQSNFYNNNFRSRSQQQSSRADEASSWRTHQDPFLVSSNRKIRDVGEKHPGDTERHSLNTSVYQRDTRVSLWCTDVQRHRLSAHTNAEFTVFNDAQFNQAMPIQYQQHQGVIGTDLNVVREPPGLLLSPFHQSMRMHNLVDTMPASAATSTSFTSAHLRPPETLSPSFLEPHKGFSQLPGRSCEVDRTSSRVNQRACPMSSFSPWSQTNSNALHRRDPNQQSVFNSNLMMPKNQKCHNEIAIKTEDTCKSNPTENKREAPTWSEVAASNPQTWAHRLAKTAATPTANTSKAIEQTKSSIMEPLECEHEEANILLENSMDIDTKEEPTKIPLSDKIAVPSTRESRYITDSLAFISSGISNDQNISVIRPYTVLKIKNISWNVSASDIYDTLSRYKILSLPNVKNLPQCVHILMDVKTGKTLNTAYVELQMNVTSIIQIDQAIRNITIPQAQGRHIVVSRSSYDELCNDLFSGWKGEFKSGMACPYTDSRDSTSSQKSLYYISQKDLQRLLNVCRFFKAYYNRKCADRPFEYLITIIMNMPWKQPHAVTTAQRDIIYECYKLATESLYNHVNRPYHSFDDELLPRMVRAAITCDGFTVRQKKVVLLNAKAKCPDDLESYMQEPIINASGFTSLLR